MKLLLPRLFLCASLSLGWVAAAAAAAGAPEPAHEATLASAPAPGDKVGA